MSKFNWLILFALLVMAVGSAESYRILVVFPCISKSHAILGEGVVRHLLKAGHQITYMSSYPLPYTNESVQFIDVKDSLNIIPADVLDLEKLMNKEIVLSNEEIYSLGLEMQKVIFEDKVVKDFLKDTKQRFDAVVAEWIFNELVSGFAAIYGCPMIWVNTMYSHWSIKRIIDEPTSAALSPDITSSNLPPFTFLQRAQELWTQMAARAYIKFVIDPRAEEAYRSAVAPWISGRGRAVPAYSELVFNASLVLANYHNSFGLAPSAPQNYKDIGGYHITVPTKPLPQNIKQIMENAKHGVIYFSMGSNLQSKNLPDDMKQGLLKTFGTFKQTVIWKFEEVLPNLPANVHIVKWAPQQSILDHPKCIMFITHGGLLSTTETVHFGVPIIGIPVFLDQGHNIDKAIVSGYAKRVELSRRTPALLREAIEEMLNNPKYTEKAREVSSIFHDRPVPPGEELVHWVEHVVRTKGAPHLRSPALMVPWYQKIYLDLAALLFVILYASCKLCKIILCKSKFESRNKKNN